MANETTKKVAVIMGSDSDLPTVKPAIDKLKSYGVPVEAHVMSAHRTPAQASEFAANAKANGFGAIIAAAGKQLIWAAFWQHTPPCRSSGFRLNPLLWMVWMPCWLPFRCLPASRLLPLPSTAQKMQPFWQFRCWHSATKDWQQSWMR